MGRYAITVLDSDGDRTQASIPTNEPETDGSNYTAWRTRMLALNTATEGILRSVNVDYAFESETVQPTVVRPTDPDVQNSDQWVVEFLVVGMDGGPYTKRFPGANRSIGVIRNGRVELELSTGLGAAFKSAFEDAFEYEGQLDNPSAPAVDGQNAGEAIVQTVYVRGT